MTDVNAIATQFTSSYYQTFDTNRAALANLYRDNSTLTFEGQSFVGAQAITEKLLSLSFQTIQHVVTTVDSQMTVDGGLLVFVVGQLRIGGMAVFSPVYCKRLNLRPFSEQIPLIFKWVEHKCFDVADNDSVFGFSQTFYLKQIESSLFVMNDIFRLALHHQ